MWTRLNRKDKPENDFVGHSDKKMANLHFK